MNVEGKVAVVTGATRGIGLGLARSFARAGMKVVLAALHQDALDRTVTELNGTGADVLTFRTDVARLADVEALAEATLDQFGGAHVLCNNAGVATFAPYGQQCGAADAESE